MWRQPDRDDTNDDAVRNQGPAALPLSSFSAILVNDQNGGNSRLKTIITKYILIHPLFIEGLG